MVVSAPYIDHNVEALRELFPVVGNIGCEISGDPVAPDNYPVLVVTEVGCAEPECALILIKQALFTHVRDGICYVAVIEKGLL